MQLGPVAPSNTNTSTPLSPPIFFELWQGDGRKCGNHHNCQQHVFVPLLGKVSIPWSIADLATVRAQHSSLRVGPQKGTEKLEFKHCGKTFFGTS